MEEAIEILWSYARREPLDSNGETIVPTVNNSIAAIRILSRLEGWEKESEKRTVKPSEYMELGYVGEKRNPCWRELAARAEDTEANKVENTPYCRELQARGEDTEVCKIENAAHQQDSSSVFPLRRKGGHSSPSPAPRSPLLPQPPSTRPITTNSPNSPTAISKS